MNTGFGQALESGLLARARRGEHDAFAEIYRMFGPAAFTLARRLVKRPDVAEEIVQETFLDVMRKIGTFRNDAPFGYWLRRIVVNRCLMFLRSYWEQHGNALEDEPLDPIDGFDAVLCGVDLAVLLETLPAISRTVLWLHDVEGYTHREIGDLLGRTASFSKSQLARSHAELRQRIALEAKAREEMSCTSRSGT